MLWLQKGPDGRLLKTDEYLSFLRFDLGHPTTWNVSPDAALQLLDEVEALMEESGRLDGRQG